MEGSQKFFRCKHCGNILGLIVNRGVPVVCCGEDMQELVANTQENVALEKHLPVVTVTDGRVRVLVGSAVHPMEEGHHIAFIYLETKQGGQRKALTAGQAPDVTFALTGDTPVAAFAYCNLHGLWRTTVNASGV